MTESWLPPLIGLVFALAIGAALWQNFVAPRRRRAVFRSEMQRRGFTPVDVASEEWRALLAVARPGPLEVDREEHTRESVGPLAVDYRRRIRETGFEAEVYRFPGRGDPPRLIALASWTHQRDTRSGLTHQRRRVGYDQLWVGELRELPVPERLVAYDYMQALLGSDMSRMAAARGLAADALGEAPSEHPLGRRGRGVMERQGVGAEVRGRLVLAPTAWVLEAPQSMALARLEKVLELAEGLSSGLIGAETGPEAPGKDAPGPR